MIHPITKTLLALGCAGTFAASANAQVLTTYTAGDFLLGFRQVGTNNSVVADIGPITNFTSSHTFNINLGSTLNTQYGNSGNGNSFANDPNVFFSLSETDGGDTTSFVTSAEYLTGPNAGPATIFPRLNTPNSRVLQGKINSFGAEYTSAGQLEPKTDPNAYANYMPGGSTDAGHASGGVSYGFFNPTIEGNFGQGTAGVALDLIQLATGSGPGTDLGTFQLSANGNTLTFTPEGVAGVPEPSSYVAAAIFGSLALFGFLVKKAREFSADAPSA